MNLSFNSASSIRSCQTESGPKSCESRKSTTEIVLAISSVSFSKRIDDLPVAQHFQPCLSTNNHHCTFINFPIF
jgi:hypothetical protein